MSIETFYRDSWVEIRLDAIKENMKQLQKTLDDKTGIYAVVKANAYGHGDVQVAQAALESGAYGLAVSLLDEALILREAGVEAPILVMGWVRPEDAPVAVKYNITLTAFQTEWVESVKNQSYEGALSLHLKWDSGMGRIGVRTKEELHELLLSCQDEKIQIDGIFTHFATADELDLSYFHKQQERFEILLEEFNRHWNEDVEIHTGNSAASMRFPEKMHHVVRFGISMYGLYPSTDVKALEPIPLQPAFSLHSKLIHVKKLPKGESISYGATYTTSSEEWIGTVPLGYADGWIRKLQGMEVLVEGKRMPIVGRICMDQFMVRLDQPYPVGTKVTLIGKQMDQEITIDEIADYLDTINYEIPCMISYRVPRIYVKDKNIIEVDNSLSVED
ncbi:alanine racemase [Pontibacillus marinus]|uniref:Alanine racemase n=1 Tax=Pontibacillus marinus BH030004 = DSM 16465 TaxID=1385511 RepID=A0A0A5G6Z6_9BACI|nr:alanine racemase [Pontibacillus marinus]KGX87834.1 alanine racemase [Pontibacillus marinus BH030004 = DSM 16465]